MNNESYHKTSINWYPGHMAKTRRQIIEDLKLVDIVIELLDSRIPISSRNPDMENITKNKRKIVVLNKCDLSDDKENQRWISYFKSKGHSPFITTIVDALSLLVYFLFAKTLLGV